MDATRRLMGTVDPVHLVRREKVKFVGARRPARNVRLFSARCNREASGEEGRGQGWRDRGFGESANSLAAAEQA